MAAEREDVPPNMSVEDVGLIEKYRVYKILDCEWPGCVSNSHLREVEERTFVLKPESDPLARQALRRYAQVAYAQGRVKLARDIGDWLTGIDRAENQKKLDEDLATMKGVRARQIEDAEKFARAMDDEGETF